MDNPEQTLISCDYLPVAYQSLDRDGIILTVNRNWLVMTGYDIKDVVGKYFTEFLDDNAISLFNLNFEKMVKEGLIRCENFQMRHKSGKLIDVQLIGEVQRRNGKFERSNCVLQDITEQSKIQKDLFESRQKYKLLAENITDVIWIFNTNVDRLTYVSPSVFRLSGFTVEEALCQPLEEILEPWSAEFIRQIMPGSIKEFLANPDNPKTNVAELQYRCKNGSSVWVETTTQKQLAKNGDVEVLGVSRRIQKRKEAEFEFKAKSDELERFFSLSLDLLCIADVNGYFHKLNKSWENTLGYKLEDIQNARFLDFIHPDDLASTLNAMGTLSTGKQVFGFENRYRAKNGNYHWIEWHSQPYGDNLIYAAARDVTQRKTHELELANMSEKLLQMNMDKDRFVSILAHDLRNPFNILLGLSDFLISNLRDFTVDEIEEQVAMIQKISFRTHNLLEDLLLWSKSQMGNLSVESHRIDFSQICEEVIESVRVIAQAKNIDITYVASENILLMADGNLIKTILRNLLSNAIKFSFKGGKVDVCSFSDKQFATIVVSDNGVGIDEVKLPKLWDAYSKISTPGTAGEGGSGFGLALCRELVSKSGGRIWVESEAGKGSKFLFTIPLYQP